MYLIIGERDVKRLGALSSMPELKLIKNISRLMKLVELRIRTCVTLPRKNENTKLVRSKLQIIE